MEQFYKYYGKENTDLFFNELYVFYYVTKEKINKFINYHTDLVIRELKDSYNLSLGGLWELWNSLPDDQQDVYIRFTPNKKRKQR